MDSNSLRIYHCAWVLVSSVCSLLTRRRVQAFLLRRALSSCIAVRFLSLPSLRRLGCPLEPKHLFDLTRVLRQIRLVFPSEHHVFVARPPNLFVAENVIDCNFLVLFYLVRQPTQYVTLRTLVREKSRLASRRVASFQSDFRFPHHRLLRVCSFHIDFSYFLYYL